ncbi:MAG: MFS transporter [Proteobacteria bacterium]|nr:MFS transporter [Pseudomonadota bacterium]
MTAASSRVRLRDYAELLAGNRNYRLLWLAQIVSEVGDWLYAVVIYNFLIERTGSARAVAAAVVLQVLPQVLTAPMAGVINDRLSRRSVMVAADLFRVLVVLAMLFASHLSATWPIYCLLFLETVMWGLFEPGRSALLPNLTRGEREVLVANTLASTTWSFNLAVGSALGGFLSVWLGRDPVFIINAASFLVSAALLLRIRCTEPHAEGQPRFQARELFNFNPVLEGFRYIRDDARLLATLLAKAGLGFLGANYVILTMLGERVFPVDGSPALGMSLLMGARGLGALIGPAIGGYWAGGREERFRPGILYGFLAASLGYIALSSAQNIWFAIACVTVAHGGGSVIWVFSTTMLQNQTDDRFRGRVFSADYAFMVLAMSTSTWIAGSAVDMGAALRHVSLAVGFMVLLPAVLWAMLAMPLWHGSAKAAGSSRGH